MSKSQIQLSPIKYGTTPKILLLGNGINKAFEKDSWDELLKKIACKTFSADEWELIKKAPYPLQTVMITNDTVDVSIKNHIVDTMLNQSTESGQADLINQLVSLPFDAILTTNYSYEIEKTMDENFYCKSKQRSKYRKVISKGNKSEDQFGLFKCMNIDNQTIWHIHGEAGLPDSMVLGHYYYGKLLSCIQHYVGRRMVYYKSCIKRKADIIPQSWIDYFMFSDVYIVGLGLDLSEIDLWWLINCKKRNAFLQGGIRYFEANMNDEKNYAKKLLADAYGMKIYTEQVSNDGYISYLSKVVTDICNTIELM